jgi:protein-L-isoaspartate(D-aspartate) O-methyltransferase
MPTLDPSDEATVTKEPKGRGLGVDAAGLLMLMGVPDLPLARFWLGEQLRASGISEDVLGAMTDVPRHGFAPPARWRVAYLDLDLWTGVTWMTRPGTVARVVDALPRSERLRILEIGTGSGYQTAVLAAALGADVTSLEISPACLKSATERLRALGITRAEVKLGNGLEPGTLPAEFDGIVVNAALPALQTQLFGLLSQGGGVIVVPLVVSDGSQRLLRYALLGDEITVVDLGKCNFPLAIPAPGERWNRT